MKAQKKERFTSRCPAWLDPQTRQPIPEKVKTVMRIFILARAGIGPSRIAKQFNQEKVPTSNGAKSVQGSKLP